MANQLAMDKSLAINNLRDAGYSERRIAQTLGVSRGAVRRHLLRPEANGTTAPTAPVEQALTGSQGANRSKAPTGSSNEKPVSKAIGYARAASARSQPARNGSITPWFASSWPRDEPWLGRDGEDRPAVLPTLGDSGRIAMARGRPQHLRQGRDRPSSPESIRQTCPEVPEFPVPYEPSRPRPGASVSRAESRFRRNSAAWDRRPLWLTNC